MAHTAAVIKVAAIIPAFNEESRVGNVVRAALRSEVVDAVFMVDDGSVDDTFGASVTAAEQEISVRQTPFMPLRRQVNSGKTEALKTGVEAARDVGGATLDTLVFLDADSSPIWSRDTRDNMKLWQIAINSLSGRLREPINQTVMESRVDTFIGLLKQYIGEIVEPVAARREAMSVGMYQRNVFTDTILGLLERGGHAGNRAVSVDVWDGLFTELEARGEELDPWGIEGALNAFVGEEHSTLMYGVVNVGSRVKAGGFTKGIGRMARIHVQAVKSNLKLGHGIVGTEKV